MWIKSDERKTANDMFLGITNISATFFMCFKRIKNFIYKANTLPWVTYNNLKAYNTSFGKVRLANRDWACQTERCHTLSNKASLQ